MHDLTTYCQTLPPYLPPDAAKSVGPAVLDEIRSLRGASPPDHNTYGKGKLLPHAKFMRRKELPNRCQRASLDTAILIFVKVESFIPVTCLSEYLWVCIFIHLQGRAEIGPPQR